MSLITSLEDLKALGFRTGEKNSASQTSRTSGSSFGSVFKSSLGAISEEMDAIFEDAAKTYGISSRLLKAVAKAESNFNPNAVSRAGAVGVMQLMPATAKSLGVSDSYDARQNIMGGAKYLKQNLDKFGDVRLALAAYNAGPNSVQKYGGVPPYQETQNYVKKIMGYLDGEPLQANKRVTTGGTGASGSTRLAKAGTGSRDFKASQGSQSSKISTQNRESLSLLNNWKDADSLSSTASLGSLYQLSGLNGSSLGFLNGSESTSFGNVSSGALTSSLLANVSLSEDGETVTMDKESFSSLVELMRVQMMMNAGKSVGDMQMM